MQEALLLVPWQDPPPTSTTPSSTMAAPICQLHLQTRRSLTMLPPALFFLRHGGRHSSPTMARSSLRSQQAQRRSDTPAPPPRRSHLTNRIASDRLCVWAPGGPTTAPTATIPPSTSLLMPPLLRVKMTKTQTRTRNTIEIVQPNGPYREGTHHVWLRVVCSSDL